MMEEESGDLAAAEVWYRRSREIMEQLGDRLGLTSTYHETR
jgi:hypothetical protein